MNLASIRGLFLFSGVYDLVIGGAFIAAGPQLFERFAIPAPSHWGYIHFSCLMLIIFGIMFLVVALAPRSNRNLIPYGMLLKAAYVSVTGFYWINGGIPLAFKVFLFVDLVMLILFFLAWTSSELRHREPKAS